MEILNLLFRIGVSIAIFSFIWGIINIGVSLLKVGRKKSDIEYYSLKLIQYFFLVDTIFLICYEQESNMIQSQKLIYATLILLVYFIGKFQNKQMKINMFNVQIQGMANFNNPFVQPFSLIGEFITIGFAIASFVFFIFQPTYAYNPISNWFYEAITDIESTPIFGFIFKVIGFFMLVSMINKMINGLTFLFSGQAFKRSYSDNKSDSDSFDDYTEIK